MERHDSLSLVHRVVRQLALGDIHGAQHILAKDENTRSEANSWKNV
jgi:hypothetical protein